MQMRVKDNPEDIGRCGCGRSPSGYCCGWHGLTEAEYKNQLELYEHKKQAQKLKIAGWTSSGAEPPVESEGGEI
jgi:CDGSH-type Zn-finger protein